MLDPMSGITYKDSATLESIIAFKIWLIWIDELITESLYTLVSVWKVNYFLLSKTENRKAGSYKCKLLSPVSKAYLISGTDKNSSENVYMLVKK